MGGLSLITLSGALYVQLYFNQDSSLDFFINIIIGIFGSSLVTLFFALISYFAEYQRLMDEMSRSFALSMISLNQCCRFNGRGVIYRIKRFSEWKSYHLEYFQAKKLFNPFCQKCGKTRRVNELSNMLSALCDELIVKADHLENVDISDERSIVKTFNEIDEIKEKYKEKINDYLDIYKPGVKVG